MGEVSGGNIKTNSTLIGMRVSISGIKNMDKVNSHGFLEIYIKEVTS